MDIEDVDSLLGVVNAQAAGAGARSPMVAMERQRLLQQRTQLMLRLCESLDM
jgi:hypothetical protein